MAKDSLGLYVEDVSQNELCSLLYRRDVRRMLNRVSEKERMEYVARRVGIKIFHC